MNVTSSVGYDVVVEIDPRSYAITRDADDVAYAFAFDDETQAHVARAAEAQLDRPTSASAFDLEPGYIRLQTEADPREAPEELASTVSSIATQYNHRHADHPADQLRLADRYVGVYRPDGALTADEFEDRYLDADDYPETGDGPVLEWTHDVADDAAGGHRRHVAFEILAPIDQSTYERQRGFVADASGFRWEDADAQAFEKSASRHVRQWSSGSVERLAVWPTHVRLTAHVGSVAKNPRQLANEAMSAVSSCLPSAVEFTEPGFVGALEPPEGEAADDWIADRRLDDVDGEPYEPESPAPDEAGGFVQLNPFGGDD